MQLVLYAAVIKEKQGFFPELFIENLKGERILIEISENYINDIYNRAVKLKNKIEEAERASNINQLAIANGANCKICNFRTVCNEYKTKAINIRIDNVIDIKGEIISINASDVEIQVPNRKFTIIHLSSIDKIKLGNEVFIYNLFLPDEEKDILFTMKSTIIEYGEN